LLSGFFADYYTLGLMTRIATTRLLAASLAGAAAFFIVPAICIVIGWFQMPFLNADGTPDNAPARGGAAFVLSSPVLFLLIVAFAFVGGWLLQHYRRLNPRALFCVVVVVSLAAGILPAAQMPFGWLDALIMFLAFAVLTFLASGVCAWVWWAVAMRPNRTVEKDGPQAARLSP
jgi:hypothetical protein